MYATGIADLTPGRPARLLDVVVGSHSAWRIAMPLAAALQNSHQDGGCVFLILVADPRTARLCNIDRFGSTGPRLGDRVRGEAAEGRCPAGLAVDGLVLHRRTISLPLCLRSLKEIRRRRRHIIEKRTHHRHQHCCLPRDADVRRRRQNHQARGRNLLQHPRRWGRYGPTDAPERRVVARIYWWRLWALAELCGKDMVLPMNSGAEAVESGFKVARKWGHDIKGVPAVKGTIVLARNNFHGRTTTIISFSDDVAARRGFGPYTPGSARCPSATPTRWPPRSTTTPWRC